MKVAEALILRADLNKRMLQLRERLVRSTQVQEGDAPAENPTQLLAELEQMQAQFTSLVKRINRTNAATPFSDGMTLTDALADRDGLAMARNHLQAVIDALHEVSGNFRYSRSEIKYVATLDVKVLQANVDDLARRFRELDTIIQQMNWQVDVLE
jgi:hypothetical protein